MCEERNNLAMEEIQKGGTLLTLGLEFSLYHDISRELEGQGKFPSFVLRNCERCKVGQTPVKKINQK